MTNVRAFARVLALTGLLAVGTSPLAAQGGLGLGAAIGANLPSGDYADGAKQGVVASGFLQLRTSDNVALRGELFWSRSDIDNPLIDRVGGVDLPSGFGNVTGDVDLIGGIANVVFSFGSSALRPYAIGGAGVYRRRVAQDIEGTIDEFRQLDEKDTEFGWNAGAGLRVSLGGIALFVEGRYHSVRTDPVKTNFIPVMLGIEF